MFKTVPKKVPSLNFFFARSAWYNGLTFYENEKKFPLHNPFNDINKNGYPYLNLNFLFKFPYVPTYYSKRTFSIKTLKFICCLLERSRKLDHVPAHFQTRDRDIYFLANMIFSFLK